MGRRIIRHFVQKGKVENLDSLLNKELDFTLENNQVLHGVLTEIKDGGELKIKNYLRGFHNIQLNDIREITETK